MTAEIRLTNVKEHLSNDNNVTAVIAAQKSPLQVGGLKKINQTVENEAEWTEQPDSVKTHRWSVLS